MTRLLWLVLILVVFFATVGCGPPEPRVVPGVDSCHECGMIIDRPNESCGYVQGGEFVTFDSPGCLLASFDRAEDDGTPTEIYFADHSAGSFHPAEHVTFLLTTHLPTVMNGGALCFVDRAAAESLRQHDDEVLTDWLGYRTIRGTPDRVIEFVVEPTGMNPEVFHADKGDLVLFRARANGLVDGLELSVKGYPEIGSVELPASGEPIEFRLMAVRPGTGFPIIRHEDEKIMGMLKVAGAHTADEEAM